MILRHMPFLSVLAALCLLATAPALAADSTTTTKTTKTVTTKTTKAVPKAAAKAVAKPAAKAAVKPVVKTAAAKPAAATAAKPVTKEAAKKEPTDPADNVNAGPQLPVPRFVTLGTDEVNVRTGPGQRYPIKFVIRKDGLPVEITREFDVWRQIRDVDGDGGWVHKSMLSGRRAVVIKGRLQTLLKKPDEADRPVVKLEPGVIADLQTCREAWCSLKIASYNGWLKKADIWGVYLDETFKE